MSDLGDDETVGRPKDGVFSLDVLMLCRGLLRNDMSRSVSRVNNAYYRDHLTDQQKRAYIQHLRGEDK